MKWKSAKQIENEKDELLKKVYYAYVMPIHTDYDLIDLQLCENSEYKAICKDSGRIYSIEDFNAAFNGGEINSELDYLRILQ